MPDTTKAAGEGSGSGSDSDSGLGSNSSLLIAGEDEKVRRWICSDVQRCWCCRLWRVWSVAENTGSGSVVWLNDVEEIRVDTAERGGGGGAFSDIEVGMLMGVFVIVV